VESGDEGLMTADTIDSSTQIFGDVNKELTGELRDEANEKKAQAQKLESEGNLEDAIAKYNEAIELFPRSGIFFASRAECFLKMKKPNAAIKDCDKSIEINPDSAKAYKIRGAAKRYLGKYEEAAKDLVTGTKIDWDEKAQELLNFVQEKLKKRREREQKRLQKQRQKQQQQQKQRQQQQQQQQHQHQQQQQMPNFGAFPGGGGGGMPNMDPEVMAALSDKETLAKIMEIAQDPSKISKYAHDAKLMSVLEKLQSMQMGGMGS